MRYRPLCADSDDDALTLVVQTSDGASLHDCVRSSSDESPVRSPQDTANSEGPGRSRTKVKGLDAESRDVLRALPLDSELRFAGMVAAAQQAAAAALSQPSPRGDAAGDDLSSSVFLYSSCMLSLCLFPSAVCMM